MSLTNAVIAISLLVFVAIGSIIYIWIYWVPATKEFIQLINRNGKSNNLISWILAILAFVIFIAIGTFLNSRFPMIINFGGPVLALLFLVVIYFIYFRNKKK